MARVADRLPQNADGEFFVDQSCIDCATCRMVAPDVFADSDEIEMSYVREQPQTEAEQRRALMALVACPTSSIGTVSKIDVEPGVAGFPEPLGEEIYYCGFAAEASFGAASYLIRREAGNILVDSPRAAKPLMKRIEALGGITTMFLTHRDDVADHEKFRARFGCERVMHADDVGAGTLGIERKVEGRAPVELAPDLVAIPVSGHTRGSMALLYRGHVLFSGDHVWGREAGELGASRSACWYSWSEQVRSMETLLVYPLDWILPGHGLPARAASPAAMHVELERLLERMRQSR